MSYATYREFLHHSDPVVAVALVTLWVGKAAKLLPSQLTLFDQLRLMTMSLLWMKRCEL
jgi:hypothetical protein